MVPRLDQRLKGIKMCLDSGFAEAALALLYSAIDTLGFLNAAPGATDVERSHFITWCDQYIVPSLNPSQVTGIDLYGARCGILHISSASSRLGRTGSAREVWYHLNGRDAVNLMSSTPKSALMPDIAQLVEAFHVGCVRFIVDLNGDCTRLDSAQERIRQFFSWGVFTRDLS